MKEDNSPAPRIKTHDTVVIILDVDKKPRKAIEENQHLSRIQRKRHVVSAQHTLNKRN